LIRVLSPILNIDESEIRTKLEPFYEKLEKSLEDTNDDTTQEYSTSSNYVILKAFPKDKGPTKEEINTMLSIAGIGIDDDYMTKIRYYPNGSIMAHTLGYVGFMDTKEAAQSENLALPKDTMIGKSGLEKKYEMELRAQPSYKLTINDKYGHEKQIIVYKKGQNGKDLRLNIDLDTQIKAELLLMENLTSQMHGSVIVLDPYTGSIDAIASFPTFDPNLFAFSMSQQEWDYINDPIKAPLYNRALSGLYPPGSTFKPFTAAIAIETNSVSNNFVFKEKIEDDIWIPSDKEWVYQGIKRYARTPGELNLSNAITFSDNIFFAYEALQIGRTTFYDFCKRFGMNEAIPFDLTIPSATISNTENISDIKLLADSGYGQGELLITPLQMASLFGAFANSGDVMQPRLINSIKVVSDNQYNLVEAFEPIIWKDNIIDSYSISTLTPMLRRVITHGTGKSVYLSGVNIHGKTGTAEIGNDESREIAWFIGFVKGIDPKLVCVTLEVPAQQGDVRFIIAQELFR
ncbi:MAG: penicillin-binding protein 2, partial [Clostridiales bacterium]|nr:penicillin-binding protein 2 [Clostridiales bacterium]